MEYKEENTYIDKKGYKRKHSDLEHRKIAFKEIYKKNRDKYPLPFHKYQVHHKDGNKKNNDPVNLLLVTEEEHEKEHGIKLKEIKRLYWTNKGRSNQGIISLNKNEIILYWTNKKILIGNKNLRQKIYAKIKLRDIKNITTKFSIFSKQLRIYLDREDFDKLTKEHSKIIQFLVNFQNQEKVLYLDVNSDSKEEISSFVQKANELKRFC